MKTQTLPNQLIPITGNTYPVKDKLKALGARWNSDHKCWMIAADKADAAHKIVSGPVYNNPIAIPEDRGPLNSRLEAEKHGREVVDTEIVPFRRDSGKGEKTTVGETFWGRHAGQRRRYLIIRDGAPYYLSRTTLEDNDDFQSDAGWYRGVETVAVEPTEDEKKNDPKAIKEAKEAAEKLAKEKAAAEKAERIAAAQPRLAEIAAFVARSEDIAGEGGCYRAWESGEAKLYVSTGFLIFRSPETDKIGPVYDDGRGGHPIGRILRDNALSAEAIRLAEITIRWMD